MVNALALALHDVAVLLFGGYILLDRLLFRPYFSDEPEKAHRFYRMSRRILLPAAGLLIFTGMVMLGSQKGLWDSPLLHLKIVLALLLLGMFFYCPRFSRGHGEQARRLYRVVVILLLLAVLLLGRFFI